jgi:glutathione synthase/RimK-type ligase-like ATP-grasp enzyme
MKPNIFWIAKAANNLSIPFRFIDQDKVIGILDNNPNLYFAHCTTPFNSQSIANITKDKFFTYEILKNHINLPKTKAYLDPNIDKKFAKFLDFHSIEEIKSDILLHFGEKVMIKRNSGQRKENVFKCFNKSEIKQALHNIFNQNSKKYDNIALAQEVIDIKTEYRVFYAFGEIHLIYQKRTFEKVQDSKLKSSLEKYIQKVTELISVNFAGFDIALNDGDELILIEINSSPRLDLYIKKNHAEQEIINIFEKILIKQQGIN